MLLLVHGTFSSTIGSFGALTAIKEGRDFLASALAEYDAVLGFDHRTLSVDPAGECWQEILQRLQSIAWPRAPEIEIVAYSRGGLVARSLVEQLLPRSGGRRNVGRMVFVGCTNGGTALAEPENWHRFADHYTNFALAANARALVDSRRATLDSDRRAGDSRRGRIGEGAGERRGDTDVVPGLAAMEPDGAVRQGDQPDQRGTIAAAAAKFYAITANFEAGQALKQRRRAGVPTKLLMRIADWGADEVYGEDNDLVVHVRAMTEIDRRRAQSSSRIGSSTARTASSITRTISISPPPPTNSQPGSSSLRPVRRRRSAARRERR